jgi:hypothetical protein
LNFLDEASQSGQISLQFSDRIFRLHGSQAQFQVLQSREFLSNRFDDVIFCTTEKSRKMMFTEVEI